MEEFFQAVGGFGEEELILCVSKIGFNLATSLPIGSLCRTIIKMTEIKRTEEIKMQWTMMLPFMSMGFLKYMSFNDYLAQCTGKNLDLRPTADIIDDVAEIRKNFERKEK